MRTVRVCAALLTIMLVACTGSSSPTAGTMSSTGSSAAGQNAAPAGCPTDRSAIESLLGQRIASVQGSANGSDAQVCAFTTSTTDLGALSVTFLRFPRADLKARTLADARSRYGTKLAGHTVTGKPSWGAGAFLDETVLPDKDLVAEFAWVPGFEIILGMHASDRLVAQRGRLIDRLVALTQHR